MMVHQILLRRATRSEGHGNRGYAGDQTRSGPAFGTAGPGSGASMPLLGTPVGPAERAAEQSKWVR